MLIISLPPSTDYQQNWRTDVLGALKSPILDFLNRIEYKAFRNFTHYIPCDALVTCSFIHPGMITKASDWHVTVELHGRETRGQLVLDHLRNNETNARIIEQISQEDMKSMLLWVCGDPDVDVEIV